MDFTSRVAKSIFRLFHDDGLQGFTYTWKEELLHKTGSFSPLCKTKHTRIGNAAILQEERKSVMQRESSLTHKTSKFPKFYVRWRRSESVNITTIQWSTEKWWTSLKELNSIWVMHCQTLLFSPLYPVFRLPFTLKLFMYRLHLDQACSWLCFPIRGR